MKKFKVEEFQIHDWVWIFDPDFKEDKNAYQITKLQYDNWSVDNGIKVHEFTDLYPEEWFEGIRLTKKILDLNLNYENDTEDGSYYSLNNSLIWGVFDKGTFYMCFNGQQNMIPIRYVHQLQQGLRLVGLIDEANNFKVKKSHDQ